MADAVPSAETRSQAQQSDASCALWQLLASQFGLGGDLIERLPVAAMSPEKVADALYVLQTYRMCILCLARTLLVMCIIQLTYGIFA